MSWTPTLNGANALPHLHYIQGCHPCRRAQTGSNMQQRSCSSCAGKWQEHCSSQKAGLQIESGQKESGRPSSWHQLAGCRSDDSHFSREVNTSASCSWSKRSSILGKGYLFFKVKLLRALSSTTMRSSPLFFLTNRMGAPKGGTRWLNVFHLKQLFYCCLSCVSLRPGQPVHRLKRRLRSRY